MKNLHYYIISLVTFTLLILKFIGIFISWWIILPFLFIFTLLTYLAVNFYMRTKIRMYKVLWEIKNFKVQVEFFLNSFKFPPEFRIGLLEMEKRYEESRHNKVLPKVQKRSLR